MDKTESAAYFFEQLVGGATDFIGDLVHKEMDAELIELLNTFGGQLKIGEADSERFQTSLLIIGYLLRAYEDRTRDQKSSTAGRDLH